MVIPLFLSMDPMLCAITRFQKHWHLLFINNYEECENEADPEVVDIGQNEDMNAWENMKISEETKALAKAMEEEEED